MGIFNFVFCQGIPVTFRPKSEYRKIFKNTARIKLRKLTNSGIEIGLRVDQQTTIRLYVHVKR